MMKIDDICVGKGEIVRGALKVGELPDTSPILLPLTIISGVERGPTLLTCSAVHGNEVNGVELNFRLSNSVNPSELRGKLIILSIANPPAYNAKQRNNPMDEKDLNRCFPGNASGSISDKIAYAIFHSLVRRADYLIDLHSGSEHFRMVPLVKIFERSYENAKFFGIRFVETRKGIKGSLAKEAHKIGVESYTFEIGEGGRLEEEFVSLGLNGILNFMRGIKMLEGKASKGRVLYVKRRIQVNAPKGGILTPKVEIGTKVKKGTRLGEVHDVFTGERYVVRAPEDGWVFGVKKNPQVYTGEKCFLLYK